jgi:hypothetical protein
LSSNAYAPKVFCFCIIFVDWVCNSPFVCVLVHIMFLYTFFWICLNSFSRNRSYNTELLLKNCNH